METFTTARELVENRDFARARRKSLAELDLSTIDDPITDIVVRIMALPYCFTLQCCYGHFLCRPGHDRHNIDPLGAGFSSSATYRIAYIALCLEHSPRGQALLQSLARLPAVAPDYVQFGSANWFWERWKNSYVLQVEPTAHRLEDEMVLEAVEARQVQAARDLFFGELRELLAAESPENDAG